METGGFTTGKIYVLKDPVSKEIRYCGQTTKTLEYRLNGHIQGAKRFKHHAANWIKSLLNRGLIPVIEIIEICDTSILNDREIFHINNLREIGVNLTNISDGGQSGSCKNHTVEAKEKISKFMKSYKKSEEHINKMKRSLGKQIYQYSLNGDFIREYYSAVEASEFTELEVSGIRYAAKRDGICGDFQWRYFKISKIESKKKYFKTDEFKCKIRISNHNRSKKI